MKHVSLRFRFLAVAAVGALVLATPLAVPAHAHPDQTDDPCRICKASGSEPVVLGDGPMLPVPQSDVESRMRGVQRVPDPPSAAPGAPRAPPS